jgi:hypothetical protein
MLKTPNRTTRPDVQVIRGESHGREHVRQRIRYAGSAVNDTGAPPATEAESAALGQYLAMARAYRRTGGLLSGDDLAMRLRKRSTQPLSLVARWIVSREVVCLKWQTQTWLPLFQFDPADMSLRSEVSGVVGELAGAMEDWDLALWFSQPNPWLDGAMPVDAIDSDQPAVLDAARVARFIARG